MVKLKVKFFPASLWKRAFAYIIDVFVINLVIVLPFQKVLDALSNGISDKSIFESFAYFSANTAQFQAIFPKLIFIFSVIAILSILYWAILEYKIGQSVGKILFHIYVKPQNKDPTFWQFFLRNVTKVSTFPLILDAMYMIFTRGRQRYFEKISKTFVVEAKYSL
ncbi:MAG: RDD family protein [Nanoarchaeota archaeon]|nr:RDD family protein [Nanoarchaeota archaeon]MCG2717331.1 RDD family protein [Nanoarchaeota archaeon]